MRNYVIINGINSNTIQGLAINILPPITKPMMRSQIEEIDGRDGDLITELGYSAYDKTMEIGLWGTYDIDAIIKYFTGEGTIVFSNEPNKYYYFKILNQIDYEKLLKFKKATVTFHCQPFKYPTSETPLEEQYEYVEATGTDLTLNNTEETIFNKFDLIGNTYQDSTTGKNLFDAEKQAGTYGNATYSVSSNGQITQSANDNSAWGSSQNRNFTLEAGTYTISCIGKGTEKRMQLRNITDSADVIQTQQEKATFTLNGTKTLAFKTWGDSTYPVSYYVQIEKGSTETTYEPYTGGIPAPNPNFPEDIHVVSGDNSIEVVGKNLLNTSLMKEFTPNSTTWYSLDGIDGFYNATQIAKSNLYYNIISGQTYTLSVYSTKNLSTSANNPIQLVNESGNVISSIAKNTTSITFTASTSGRAYPRMSVNSASTLTQCLLQLEKGSTATTFEEYQGSSYPINLGVENLLEKINSVSSGTLEDGIYTSPAISSFTTVHFYPYNSISFNTGDTLYISADIKCSSNKTNTVNTLYCADSNGGFTTTKVTNPELTTEYQRYVFKTDPTDRAGTLNRITLQESALGGDTLTIRNIMVSKQMSNYFSPYGTVPIEMCRIPNTDYKDTFVHEDNKWYKYAMINKYDEWETINSTSSYTTTNVYQFMLPYASSQTLRTYTKSSHFRNLINNNDEEHLFIGTTGVSVYKGLNVFINKTRANDSTTAKQWLLSNNVCAYYVMNDVLQTEITDETLKAQLDDLWENAISYKGQTNITQTNNDMPFILDVSALKDGSDHLIINNIGTAYSKPTIDIEGTGIVDIYLNDEQIFEIDLTTQNEIIIDTEKMEAYTPDNLLANRLVTGDYSNFKLAPGQNDLRFSGDLTKATVTRYIRWI